MGACQKGAPQNGDFPVGLLQSRAEGVQTQMKFGNESSPKPKWVGGGGGYQDGMSLGGRRLNMGCGSKVRVGPNRLATFGALQCYTSSMAINAGDLSSRVPFCGLFQRETKGK